MPDIVKVKTGNPFEERGSYSRLVAIDNLIFVSNTAGRNPQTKLKGFAVRWSSPGKMRTCKSSDG